jgi:hypothetical protein
MHPSIALVSAVGNFLIAVAAFVQPMHYMMMRVWQPEFEGMFDFLLKSAFYLLRDAG